MWAYGSMRMPSPQTIYLLKQCIGICMAYRGCLSRKTKIVRQPEDIYDGIRLVHMSRTILSRRGFPMRVRCGILVFPSCSRSMCLD